MAKTPQTTVIIPGSFTDLVRSLRELIGGLRDLGTLVGDGAVLATRTYRGKKSRSAARNLDALNFPPSGSRQYLERIAG